MLTALLFSHLVQRIRMALSMTGVNASSFPLLCLNRSSPKSVRSARQHPGNIGNGLHNSGNHTMQFGTFSRSCTRR